MKKILLIVVFASLVAGCSTPVRYDYTMEGVSDYARIDAVSECRYQILLNKTPEKEQAELLKLCMQGKGFRLTQID